MALQNQRPDTPLAATPEPQPVSSGFQAAPQQRPATKFEQTANNAIQQIELLSKTKAAAAVPENKQPNQQQ
jgi:hypothetical protein